MLHVHLSSSLLSSLLAEGKNRCEGIRDSLRTEERRGVWSQLSTTREGCYLLLILTTVSYSRERKVTNYNSLLSRGGRNISTYLQSRYVVGFVTRHGPL
jgi:hypothetical protein